MKAIFKNEMKMYFTSMSGYIFGMFVLLFAGIYSMVVNIQSRVSSFQLVPSNMVFIFIAIIPVLTMRMIAEERRQKTDQLLYSLPISMAKVVLGKYFAALVMLIIPVAIICLYPVIYTAFGDVPLAWAWGSMFGFFLLGASLIAMGMFISSLAETQAAAAGACFVLMLFNYFIAPLSKYLPYTARYSYIAFFVMFLLIGLFAWFMTKSYLAALSFTCVLEVILTVLYKTNQLKFINKFPETMANLSLFSRFTDYVNGVMSLQNIVYSVSVTALFLFLTVQSLEKRRWS